MSLPWIVEMSKHSMRRGRRLQTQHRAQRLERLEVRGDDLVVPGPVRQLGVARRQLHERPPVATLRHQELHAPPGAGRHPLSHRVLVLDAHRQVDFRRRDAALVELPEDGVHHVGVAGDQGASLDDELDALDHPAAAHREHLDHAAARPQLQAEDVAIRGLRRGQLLLALGQRLHGAQRVPQLGGFLEPLALGRRVHAPAEGLAQFLGAALQQHPGVGDRLPVALLAADLRDARRDAALDVVLQAGPAAAAVDHLVARPQPEQPVRQHHRAPAKLRREKRAGVEVAVLFIHAPCDEQPGESLARREPQIRIVFVVAEKDVVLWRPLFDEVVLERQRFHHRVGDDHVEAGDLVEQGIVTRAHARGAEVASDPVAQRPRLARRRSCRRSDCPTDTRQAAPGDARSAP